MLFIFYISIRIGWTAALYWTPLSDKVLAMQILKKMWHYENIIQLYLLPINLLLLCLSDLAYSWWANMTDHIVDATLNSDYFGREML